MQIREYRPTDADGLAQIFFRSVREVASRCYSREQVVAWAPTLGSSSGWNNCATDGRITVVAVDDADQPIAFGNVETNGHIDHLYSSPEALGTGAASAIYDHLESQAKKLGLTRLIVEASECALPFFKRKGFIEVRRNDFELRGVPIHNYAMEKTLQSIASEADRIVGLYQRHGRAWAADRGNDLFEKAWLDRFLALLPARPRILDIGCGSGVPIGRYFLENGCDITGVDSSPELIKIAQENFPAQHWKVADMRALCLNDNFNGVLAWDSFFHLRPDHQRKMFSVFRNHAASRAALMFTSGTSHGVAMGTYQGEPLYHASLDPGEYRELLKTHGFDVIAHVFEDPTCGGRTIWLSQLR